MHHSCSSPDFSDDDDCYECIAAAAAATDTLADQIGSKAEEMVPSALQSLSESVQQSNEQQMCSSMTCDHQRGIAADKGGH